MHGRILFSLLLVIMVSVQSNAEGVSVALIIEKRDVGYLASWRDKSGNVIVDITEPLSREELVDQLTTLGCHPIDIYDELKRVDPGLVLDEKISEDMNRQFKELLEKGVYPHR